MSFGSAGYTPTFSGDFTQTAGKKLWKELSRRLRKRRVSRKVEERKKAKTPQQKKEVEERAKEEEKQDQEEIQEVKVEEVKEEVKEKQKEVAATQKLLPSARSASSTPSNNVIPVTVKDVTSSSQTRLLPAGRSSSPRRGGGFSPSPVAQNLLPPAQNNVQQTTAIVKRNNDAIVTAIKGEVNDVRSAIVDVSFETVETRNMMGLLINEEQKQTAAFKKQADILEDSTKFKKRRYQQQTIFFKQQRSREKKDRTGAAAIVAASGGAAGAGGGPGGKIPFNPAMLLPFLRNWRPGRNRGRNRGRNTPRGTNRSGPRATRGLSGPGSSRPNGRTRLNRASPAARQRLRSLQQYRRNQRFLPRALRGIGRGGRGLAGLTMLGGAYGIDFIRDMAERRSMTPGRGVQPRTRLGPQVRQQQQAARAARAAQAQPTRSLAPSTRGGSAGLSAVRDPVAETRRQLAEEVRSRGLTSKSKYVTNSKGVRELVDVSRAQAEEILKKPKVPFFKRLMAWADNSLTKRFPFIVKVKKAIVKLKEGAKKLSLPKAIEFLQSGFAKVRKMIPDRIGIFKFNNLKKAFDNLTKPIRSGFRFLKKIGSGAKGLAKTFGPILKGAGRILGPLLEVGFFAADSKTRMDNGMSPAAAMLPLLPRIALTAGGATLLGALGGPLAPLTAMAGGFLGGMLGDKVVDFIDSQWSPDWDSGVFSGFNKGTYQLLADKLNYTPPKSEEEANNLRIEQEAAEEGVNPQEYMGYTGNKGLPVTSEEASRADPEAPSIGGSAGQRLLRMTGAPNPIDAASKFISSRFRTSNRPGHNGLDISGGPWSSGADLSVVNPGTVIDVGELDKGTGDPNGWGNFVVVGHADGTESLYGHLDSVDVKKGDTIRRGTIIGKIGDTGASRGAHLHFELGSGWNGGVLTNHVDPSDYINDYVSVGGAPMDGTEFRPREGTAAETTAAVLNNSISSAGPGMQTIAVQLPPNLMPTQDPNSETSVGPSLEKVKNDLLYLQNVEAKILVG